MKTLVVIGLILLVAVITNPDKADHQNALKELFADELNKTTVGELGSSKSGLELAGTAIGMSLGLALLDKLIENAVYRQNFVVFSLTEIRFDGNSKIIGIGAFGNVWLLDKNLLKLFANKESWR